MSQGTDTEVIHKEHGHDTEPVEHPHGHEDHDEHGHGGHDEHGHGGHDDHGHHAPPAPKYLVELPARVGEISVRTWFAYGIFLLIVGLIAFFMLIGFRR